MKKIVFIFALSLLAMVSIAAQVSAQEKSGGTKSYDCPCDPCSGGVYGCKDGCLSICYEETGRCVAKCTKSKAKEIKLDKRVKFSSITMNMTSSDVKFELEQLFGIELVMKGKAKKDFIFLRLKNVDLEGVLNALSKEGLVLQSK